MIVSLKKKKLEKSFIMTQQTGDYDVSGVLQVNFRLPVVTLKVKVGNGSHRVEVTPESSYVITSF